MVVTNVVPPKFGPASFIAKFVLCAVPCSPLHTLPPFPPGWSPFPGNINQLVLKLSSYVKQLEKTGGPCNPWLRHTLNTWWCLDSLPLLRTVQHTGFTGWVALRQHGALYQGGALCTTAALACSSALP